MNKTPVSFLNDIMLQNKMVADYEVVSSPRSSYAGDFTYKVTCDGLTEVRSGRCKKEAKHEAAKAMLETLAARRNYPQLSTLEMKSAMLPHIEEEDVLTKRKITNAMGVLYLLCLDNRLKPPTYILVNDNGPSHAKIFTMKCMVSTLTETGVASSKKEAKHNAARKMIDRLIPLLNTDLDELLIDNDRESSSSSETEMDMTSCEKKSLPRTWKNTILRKMPVVTKCNFGMRLKSYHNALKNSLTAEASLEICNKLDYIRSEIVDQSPTTELVREILSKLENLLSEIDVSISMKDMDSNNCFMKAIQLDCTPTLVQIGVGKTELDASFKAIDKIMSSLKLLLS